MNTALSDDLKIERDLLKQRRRFGLFLGRGQIYRLVRRLNTFAALAEELENELHLVELRTLRDTSLAGSTVVRFPGRTLIFPISGDAP